MQILRAKRTLSIKEKIGQMVIIGMDTNLEIWNTELWNEENAQYTPESVAAIMEELNF